MSTGVRDFADGHNVTRRKVASMTSEAGRVYASWPERFRALLRDAGIVLGALLVVGIGLALLLTLALRGRGDIGVVVGAAIGLLFPVPFVAYQTIFLGRGEGQTPGRRAVGIRVREASTLGRVGYGRAFARSALTPLIWFPLLGLGQPYFHPLATLDLLGILDILWPLWDPRRQALHDKVARTVVVRAPTLPPRSIG